MKNIIFNILNFSYEVSLLSISILANITVKRLIICVVCKKYFFQFPFSENYISNN